MVRCGCCTSHPLQGLWAYFTWLCLLRFLTQRPELAGVKRTATTWAIIFLSFSQLIFALGVLGGAVTTIMFLILPYTTVHSQAGSGEPSAPTVSSLCPGLWAGLFLFGAMQGLCQACTLARRLLSRAL